MTAAASAHVPLRTRRVQAVIGVGEHRQRAACTPRRRDEHGNCSMDLLPEHGVARIVAVRSDASDHRDQMVTQRLKELGFVPGNTVRVIAFGLFGRGSMAVAINGTKFALRRSEARRIMVTSGLASSVR